MRGIISFAINHRFVTYFFCALLFFGGIISFFTLGQLEDPVFSIKTAVITTKYPGAGPQEVELEVTDRLEKAIQEMPQIENIHSISRAGESIITVYIQQRYWADKLPQIWDELRKKMRDTTKKLPPGAQEPLVSDDFGFVYGFVLALTGDGYTMSELEDFADILKKELSLVKDISRVELWGVQDKVIYVDVSDKQIAGLNLTPETLRDTLERQNLVVNAGHVDDLFNRFRIAPTGEFSSPEEIGELILRPRATDIISNAVTLSEEGKTPVQSFTSTVDDIGVNLIQVKDIATVRRGYKEPPTTMMRYNGKPAIGIQIAGSDDANIVTVGEDLYNHLEEITRYLPIGLDIHKIAWQSDLVEASVTGFLWSLVIAMIIVLFVLIIPSGLRMGLIIGSDLLLTILGTFIYMSLTETPLQRMSLGALVIALGMMVDNSIVVADGIAVKIREGIDRTQAAIEATMNAAYPLLAGTLVAILAFYPIFASRDDAGEYARTLFTIVGASLLLSWFIALCITPLQCIDMIPEPEPQTEEEKDEFEKPLFKKLRSALIFLIRRRWLTVTVLVSLLIASVIGFGFVNQMFFPESTRPQLMVDYWAPQGTRIQDVSEEVAKIEKHILENPRVESVTTFVGAGPPRFYLPVDPEKPYQNYAQLIINFPSFKEIDPFIAELGPWAKQNVNQAMVRIRKYTVGPGDAWPFALRISGPAETNLNTLRGVGEEILTIAESSPFGRDWQLDMRNRQLKIVPEYDQKRGRWSSITRPDVAKTTLRAYDGIQVGIYREGDDLYPIIFRNVEKERKNFEKIAETLQIKPDFSTQSVPLAQVVPHIHVDWEDPLIMRWNRRRAVTVQGAPKLGETFPSLQKSVIDAISEVSLPPGYTLFWDGEADSSKKAQESLLPGIIPAAVLIVTILVILFSEFRPLLIDFLTIPFAIIGITVGLLIFQLPFGFMALLGAMSLAGMMNKNIVVLLDAANDNLSQGMDRYHAIIEASIRRARPVLLAAGTTVLGVIPLLADVFWVSMAATIMAGLTFGSLLTLIATPVFYAIFYRVKVPEEEL